jgi:hypothetical protein
MTGGSWPYLPAQCPHCLYFQAEPAPFTDDTGYEIIGFCRNPRIGMELFRPRKLDVSRADPCPLYVRRPQGVDSTAASQAATSPKIFRYESSP